MSSSSFSRFLDLPLEIQDEIWHCFERYRGNRGKWALLRVSRNSYAWAKDRLYHTLYIRTFNSHRIVAAVKRNPAPFQEKTRQLVLSVSSQPALIQAQEVLPIFRSLRRVYLEHQLMASESAEILFRNPNLKELTFSWGAPSFSPSARAYSPTHLILNDWSPQSLTPRAVLPHFSQLTHLAVRRMGEKSDVWLRAWCDACPSTLSVFLVVDLDNSHHVPFHISRPLRPRPVLSAVSFSAQFDWETYPAMWAATEAVIQRAEIEQTGRNYIQITY
ncbi:hypothetical protein DL96DRAFT_121731 [Flagelloscypha sp. PMI_526]|nr:hypothetical protein DL96DRAFT_121731 [Flagelloscypha sp. PMI_526]